MISDHVVGYDVVQCPRDRGDLIVLKRHLDILNSPYFLYWLYSASGAELGLAGAEELNVDALRDGTCEASQLIPPIPLGGIGPRPEGAIQVDSSLMERRIVSHVEPIYPTQARLAHVQGNVLLQVRVAADGTVQQVNLVSGPPQLAAAAIAAVKQWQYQPTMLSEHPVPVVTVVNVPFHLPSTDK